MINFFKFILFYFLTLQYCIGFAIYQHESATGIHVFPILNPPPSPYHPSGSSQCTSPKHPVSCVEPGLVTRFIYDIIHVSMPFSQIIPPSPSPTESKRLFYTSVSLENPRDGGAWWTAVYGVAQSWTRLMQLSSSSSSSKYLVGDQKYLWNKWIKYVLFLL